jgi:hypothetical protein
MALGVGVLAVLGITSKREIVEGWHLWKLGLRGGEGGIYVVVPRSAEFAGEPVRILAGDIELLEILRFLSDFSGLPIYVRASHLSWLQNTITIAAPIDAVTGNIGAALLKANGFPVTLDTLTYGKAVVLVDAQPGEGLPFDDSDPPTLPSETTVVPAAKAARM